MRVTLEGSGFMLTSLVRVNGVSVKTTFVDPRKLEFEMPGERDRAGDTRTRIPRPGRPEPGADRLSRRPVHVFNPPPEGGTSNTVNQMIVPK